MKKIAVFPGSFDPFTVGHESIVNRATTMFDSIIIMVGENSSKNCLFSIESRVKMIVDLFFDNPKIEVKKYCGLTIEFCREVKATFILRGLRTSADFEYERAIAQINKKMYPQIETVFLLTLPEHTPISSSVIRDILKHNGDVTSFIPNRTDIKKYLNEDRYETNMFAEKRNRRSAKVKHE